MHPARLLYATLLLVLCILYLGATYGPAKYINTGAHEALHCYIMHEDPQVSNPSDCEIYIEPGGEGYIMSWADGIHYEHIVIHATTSLVLVGVEAPAIVAAALACHALRTRPKS